jgi:hypothetical protein
MLRHDTCCKYKLIIWLMIMKEMASDSLEWHVMQSPSKKTGVVLLASRILKVCGLHIG